MASFQTAISFVLGNEGGFQADPNDSGNYDDAGNLVGTRYGISAKVARAYGYDGPMEDLPLEVAMSIYGDEYWTPWMDEIKSDAVAAKILDYRVNFGPGGGTILAQRAANRFQGVNIAEDGGLGPETVAAINSLLPASYMTELVDVGRGEYQAIADRNPSQAGFLPGWMARVVKIPQDYPVQSAGVLLLLAFGLVLLLNRKQFEGTTAGMLLLCVCAALLVAGRR